MPVSRRQFATLLAVAGAACGGTAGCVRQAAPAPFVARTSAPPWDAPRDAVSNLRAAGLPELPLNDTSDPHVFTMTLTLDSQPMVIPAHIGVDRVRAVQAPAHTHDETGQVWLEGRGNDEVTLGQWFTLWGVRATPTAFGPLDSATWHVSVDDRPSSAGLDLVLRTVAKRLDVVVAGG
ncbi:hypothetical protein ACSDQ9_02525 [Aestuariimicrobium soli]|uniref:hypothetical protein n=1 Tax=Aestuariimicrobium soli TaxID=2035834 RepID=UPI003EBDA2E1